MAALDKKILAGIKIGLFCIFAGCSGTEEAEERFDNTKLVREGLMDVISAPDIFLDQEIAKSQTSGNSCNKVNYQFIQQFFESKNTLFHAFHLIIA